MARKQIPLADKKKVVERLAKGQSYNEARNGTAIASTDTVHRIAKEKSSEIEKKRDAYLKLLEDAGATDEKSARVIADAMRAKIRRRDLETGQVWYEKDHKMRLDTVKYYNSLKGRGADGKAIGIKSGDGTIEVIIKDF